MTRISYTTVFAFDELSPDARAKAIEDHRQFLSDNFDCDWLTEDFKAQLEEVGLPHKDVYWRLSYCQGDGVGFYGPVNLRKLMAAFNIPVIPGENNNGDSFEDIYSFNIRCNNSHYNHECSGTAEIDEDYHDYSEADGWEDAAEALCRQIQVIYHDWSIKLRNQGYAAIEGEQEDEYVLDSILANEYEFYADGTLYHEHNHSKKKKAKA